MSSNISYHYKYVKIILLFFTVKVQGTVIKNKNIFLLRSFDENITE